MRLRYATLSVALLAAGIAANAQPQPASAPPLKLVQIIPLPGVQGRIDHLTVDVARRRVILSGLGNDTVEAVDVFAGRRIHTIEGLNRPQGVVYAPELDRLFVANEGTGKVNIYDGATYQMKGSADFGENVDNLRYDAQGQRVYVGYGEGAIGAVDAAARMDSLIKLPVHPESFQFEKGGAKIYINLADENEILAVDRDSGAASHWKLEDAAENFPMALDEAAHRLFVVTRKPARLKVFDTGTGRQIASLATVSDADDLAVDAGRRRLYVIGGEGAIAAYQQESPDRYRPLGTVPSRAGACTGVFFAQRDRLFVAAPSTGDQVAALFVYDPQD